MTKFPGKKPASYTLCPTTKEHLDTLARRADCSTSDFVEGLSRTYADTYANQLLAGSADQEGDELGRAAVT